MRGRDHIMPIAEARIKSFITPLSHQSLDPWPYGRWTNGQCQQRTRRVAIWSFILWTMNSTCGCSTMKWSHWKGFGVSQTTFSPRDNCDMEFDGSIRTILLYRDQNCNHNWNRILNPCSVNSTPTWPLRQDPYWICVGGGGGVMYSP